MPSRRLLRVTLFLILALPVTLEAQVPAEVNQDTTYQLVLDDGSSFVGRVELLDPQRLVFVTNSGVRLEVPRDLIRTLRPLESALHDGEVWGQDPNRTRLFFGPTGRSLESGEGYLGLYELFFAFGAVGAGDHLVLAAGTPVIPGAIGQVFYLAPKLRAFSVNRADFAVGALAFFFTQDLDVGSMGIVYGVGTLGDTDDALTVGAGWGFALGGSDSWLANDPVFLVGGETRTSRSAKLITENYLFGGDSFGGIFSGGVRFIGERFSADIGLGTGLIESDLMCCLPVLSASYNF